MANDNILVFIDEARRDLAYSQCFAREQPSAFAHHQVVKATERYEGYFSFWPVAERLQISYRYSEVPRSVLEQPAKTPSGISLFNYESQP